MDKQLKMIEEDSSLLSKKEELNCKYHKHVIKEQFIDVLIKSTGKTVKRCWRCEREAQENKKLRILDWKAHKEEVSDYYVRSLLARGRNTLKAKEYPEALVQAKQAAIKLNKAIAKAKEPLKKCPKHGDLYKDDVIKAGKEKSGNPRFRCKQCMRDIHAKHYDLNKIKILHSHKKYREVNEEKVKQTKRDSNRKNRHKYRERENLRKKLAERIHCKELSNRYVKKLIVKRTGISMSDVPDNLIDCMRAVQKLKRNIKFKSLEKKYIPMGDKINGENKDD